MNTKVDLKVIIEQFVDYLLPELTSYEAWVYIYLFRNSFLKSGASEARVGKRTIAQSILSAGRNGKGGPVAYAQVTKNLEALERKGCVKIGDANRYGTQYIVILPKDIPLVAEKIARLLPDVEEDYFKDPAKRHEIFERDKWICQYCGEKVTLENATLDHYIPQVKGGGSQKDNLKTCCHPCNSIKSGKTYEEAAPLLLRSIQERRTRSY